MLAGDGRVAMVSGATRGIGRAIVEQLLAEGWRVSAGIRTPRGLAETEQLFTHRYDAEQPGSAETWVAATQDRFGAIHALVNAAGINAKASITDPDETGLDALWAVNVKGPLRVIRAALPALKACGEGRVVNVSSLSGKRVANENVGYAMSKFALMAITQAVRREGWDSGIRATSLCPGFVATDMTAAAPFPRDAMTDPKDLAVLVATVLRLPNTATVGELLVNCRYESLL